MTPLSKIPPKHELYSDVPTATVHEDPHTTIFFFCTPQDAGVVKDARV